MKSRKASVVLALLVLSAATSGGRGEEPCIPVFDAQPDFSVGHNFGMNLLRDFDRDGHVDLTTGLVFQLGDGTGRFSNNFRVDAPFPDAFDMRADDFDGDGYLDVAAIGFGSEEVMFLYGKENPGDRDVFEKGIFVRSGHVAGPVWHLDQADFNGDDRTDLVAISFAGGPLGHALFINEGNRRFTARKLPSQLGGHMLTVGDFNGDGHDDVALGSGNEVSISLGRGDGTFEDEALGILRTGDGVVGGFESGHRFRSADFDRDGRSDLVATGGGWLVIYLGRDFGTEPFSIPRESSLSLPIDGFARFIEIVDTNLDGTLDIVSVAISPDGESSVFKVFLSRLENGVASFANGKATPTGLSGRGAVLGISDVDEDGTPDLVMTTEDTFRGRVFFNADVCEGAVFPLGDANADGDVNLSDPIAVLNFLFSGDELACVGTAEVNADGTLNLADPVYLLTFLFQGGAAPVGSDPTTCAPL